MSVNDALYAGAERWFRTAKLPMGTTCFRVRAIAPMGNSSAGVSSGAKITAKSSQGNIVIPRGFAAVSCLIKRG